MYLAYIDDSGDPGPLGSTSFALACVLVCDEDWLGTLYELIQFRRGLRQIFGVPVSAELKANIVIRGKGPLKPLRLSDPKLRRIFNLQLRVQPTMGTTHSFAIVINKQAHYSSPQAHHSVESRAWEYLLQRLERFSTLNEVAVVIIHDDGRNPLYRGLARKWRRFGSAGSHYGTGSLLRPFTGLLDDPNPRDSRSSYFLQLADFAAYSAFRKVYPPTGAFPGTHRIADQHSWDRLGDARYGKASYRKDGIVAWP